MVVTCQSASSHCRARAVECLAGARTLRHIVSRRRRADATGEFAAYGLPGFAFYLVGALKIGAAIVLIAGVWITLPVRAAAGLVAALMIGAIVMHFKVGDPLTTSLPAALMLAMSAAIVALR